ncbi:MAG: arylsulfatase A [Planctomycetota bacterium]|jgi:arylsulfatase A
MISLTFFSLLTVLAPASERPNVVVILADDMGYGDVHALNPGSALATPHLDRLSEEGMTFVDAHSPSAVCTPTRYGLLTGRYCWRSRLTKGVLGGYSEPLLDEGQATLGTLLQSAGWRTGAVGKWHLGMRMPLLAEDAKTGDWSGDPGIDFAGRITDGPTQHGFDDYFGVSASLDMAPYVYIRNDLFDVLPSERQKGQPFPHFVRPGPRSVDFRIENVLDDLTREAVEFIKTGAKSEQPFFLYMPLTAPHKPTLPHDHFRGRTTLGEYGDFIEQVDWSIGRVLQAIDDAGVTEDTLVVFTSDNGSYMYLFGEDQVDHTTDSAKHGFRPSSHRPNGPWRGTKADVYEAGHRVPFFVRWPGRVQARSRCAETICHVDLFATLAEAFGLEMPTGAARDSYSLLPLLDRVEGAERGAPVVNHSINGTFALRNGKWKAIFSTGSGGRQKPAGKAFDGTRLFDLALDPGETTDVAAQHPELVADMTRQLEVIRAD